MSPCTGAVGEELARNNSTERYTETWNKIRTVPGETGYSRRNEILLQVGILKVASVEWESSLNFDHYQRES